MLTGRSRINSNLRKKKYNIQDLLFQASARIKFAEKYILNEKSLCT